MRFLIADYDYVGFQQWLYAQHPGLEQRSYAEQLRVRMERLFGLADFYSDNLRRLGHEAYDVRPVDDILQRAWAREHGIRLSSEWSWQFRWRRRIVPWVSRSRDSNKWMYEVLSAQIKHYRPDVLLNQAVPFISTRFLREMKPYVRLLVGQHAATCLREDEDWSVYDLMISSFPPTLEWFRRRNIAAELSKLGFDARVLTRLQQDKKIIPVSFVGSFFEVHKPRTALLEQVAERVPLKIWGASPNGGFSGSRLRECYMGTAWGIDMFNILASSSITVNHHGDVPAYANNQRLFEATGVGTLLITDMKENLREMFEPGKEVVAYRTPEECVELIQYYLEHENEREAIARSGQKRTLREHTYYHRMQELVDVLHKYL